MWNTRHVLTFSSELNLDMLASNMLTVVSSKDLSRYRLLVNSKLERIYLQQKNLRNLEYNQISNKNCLQLST